MVNNGYTEDTRFAARLNSLFKLFESSLVEYCIVGSCAVQSYLSFPRRLPNDADVLVRAEDLDTVAVYLRDNRISFDAFQGRIKFQFDQKTFDVITTPYTIFNRLDQSIIGQLDLQLCLQQKQKRNLQLLFSDETVSFPTLDSGHCLFLELARPLNTNSFFSVLELTNIYDAAHHERLQKGFTQLYLANQHFHRWVAESLRHFEDKLQTTDLKKNYEISTELFLLLRSIISINV